MNNTDTYNTRNNIVFQILLFIVCPFASFLFAIINFRRGSSFWFVLAFLMLFGYTHFEVESMDSFRWKLYFINAANDSFASIWENSKESIAEPYVPLLFGLVSRITNNQNVLFAIISFIFYFFYLSSIKVFIHGSPRKLNILQYIMFGVLFFCVPASIIGGVRWGTGLGIFLFGLIQYIRTEKKSYFAYMFCAGLCHIAFFPIATFMVLIFLFCKSRQFILLAFLCSFVFQFLDFSGYVTGLFGSVVDSKIDVYSSEVTAIENQRLYGGSSWHIVWFRPLLFWYLCIVTCILYQMKKHINFPDIALRLLSAMWIVGILINLSSSIPEASNRIRPVFFFLGIAFLLILSFHNKYFYRRYDIAIGVPIMLFFIAVSTRYLNTAFSLELFYKPLIIIILNPGNQYYFSGML